MNCPNCDTYINEINFIKTEFHEDTNCYDDYMRGRCSNCGKTYDWIEVYIFSHFKDIEEVQPDE